MIPKIHIDPSRFKAFVLLAFCISVSAYSPINAAQTLTITSANVHYHGENNGDFSGESMLNLGDINNSGRDDLFIGSPFFNTTRGRGYFLYDVSLNSPSINLSSASLTINGTTTFQNLSRAVSSFGDIDNDGIPDLGLAVPKDSFLQFYLGKDSGTWTPGTVFPSIVFFSGGQNLNTASGENVPNMLSFSGDVNGDGFDDILIGGDQKGSNSNDNGRAFLIFGRSNTTPLNNGNLDGDSAITDIFFQGESIDDHAGYSVSIAPDLNGDGFDDILISAYNSGTDKGLKVYLIYGERNQFSSKTTTKDFQLSDADSIFYSKEGLDTSNFGQDGFGELVTGLGDINGDGFGDFAIGAPNSDNGKGAIYIYYGATEKFTNKSTTANLWSAKLKGGNNFAKAGLHAITSPGDINGDLLNDLLIGEYQGSSEFTSSGRAYVLFGAEGSHALTGNVELNTSADVIIIGTKEQDQVGYSVSSAGDLDGDGLNEFMVAANKFDTNRGISAIFSLQSNTTPNVSGATLKLYEDSTFSTILTQAANRDTVYVEIITAGDGETGTVNILPVVASSNAYPKNIRLNLKETGVNTKTFRGAFQMVRSRSSEKIRQLSANLSETISVKTIDFISAQTSATIVNATPLVENILLEQEGIG
ncbi:MAG: hypothetical protein ACI9BD_001457, partial [Candidatus Marinamargulisbacteria bacterium]